MALIVVACVLALTAIYAILLAYFTVGALRLPHPAAALRTSAPALAAVSGSGPGGRPSAGARGGTERLPSVSVIVPMRNEEDNAPATLRALAEQDFAGEWEVVCVDDRSHDGTGRILEAFCAADPRFTLISIPAAARSVCPACP